MTPPAVSAPPPPAANKAAAPAPAPELRARAPLSRTRPDRPPLLTARTIGVSLVLHLLFLIAVLLIPRPDRRFVTTATGPHAAVEYLEVGEWGGMATDPSASLPEPAPLGATAISAAAVDSILRNQPSSAVRFPDQVPTGIPQAPGAPGAGQPGGVPAGAQGVPGGQPGAAGRYPRSGPGGLGPEFGDRRLVVTPQAVPERELDDEERYQQHFAGRINRLNDSIAGEAERQRRATDWTFRDRSGRRWGIDNNGPVVAGRNVPIPVPVPVPRSARDREDEARRERDQRREIDRQADQTERARYLRERQRAIRERNDREREKAREDAEDGDTPP